MNYHRNRKRRVHIAFNCYIPTVIAMSKRSQYDLDCIVLYCIFIDCTFVQNNTVYKHISIILLSRFTTNTPRRTEKYIIKET